MSQVPKESDEEDKPQSIEAPKSSEKLDPLPEPEDGLDHHCTIKPEADGITMDEDSVSPATVFSIRLKQPRSNLQHKMSVPELCRNFRFKYYI